MFIAGNPQALINAIWLITTMHFGFEEGKNMCRCYGGMLSSTVTWVE